MTKRLYAVYVSDEDYDTIPALQSKVRHLMKIMGCEVRSSGRVFLFTDSEPAALLKTLGGIDPPDPPRYYFLS